MYRVQHNRSKMYVVKIENPRPKFAGDVGAYYKYVRTTDEATIFTNYADAELPGIMLGHDLSVLNMDSESVSRETAMADGTFHSVRLK